MTTRDNKIRSYSKECEAKKKRLDQERNESRLLLGEMLLVMSKRCIRPYNKALKKELEDIKLAQLVSDNVLIKLQKDHDKAAFELHRFISIGA
jgi:hypothetical protein